MDCDDSLADVVARAAVAAATRDGRFDAVRREELPELHIEISVLGPVSAIDSDEVEVGRHGLVVQLGSRRGLLLPQVPVDRGWDRETFLGWTCRKAGLPADAWKRTDCELLGFTAPCHKQRAERFIRGASVRGAAGSPATSSERSDSFAERA
jgi:AmmeMemoRadiSam system protein A